MHNYILINADTDAVTVSKPNGEYWSEEERKKFLDELNKQFPEKIKFEDDGYFCSIIVARAKNYVLYDGKKIKIKGSAFKSSQKSEALKAFLNDIIHTILNDRTDYVEVYNKYVKQIFNIKTKEEMKKWAAKKTFTERVEESDRSNEVKVREAIANAEIFPGDKFHVFYRKDNSLSLVENFDGDYNTTRLLKNLFDTTKTFETVLNKDIFVNYSLKKNQPVLQDLLKS